MNRNSDNNQFNQNQSQHHNPLHQEDPWGQLFKGPLGNFGIPNFNSNKMNGKELDLSWLDSYIQGVLAQTIPNYKLNITNDLEMLNPEVFDTHDYMIVRVNLPQEISSSLKVFISYNQLILKDIENNLQKKIVLPAIGRAESSQAIYKDQALEIKIPKSKAKDFKEIPIDYR